VKKNVLFVGNIQIRKIVGVENNKKMTTVSFAETLNILRNPQKNYQANENLIETEVLVVAGVILKIQADFFVVDAMGRKFRSHFKNLGFCM
jgi:hypothetical protein